MHVTKIRTLSAVIASQKQATASKSSRLKMQSTLTGYGAIILLIVLHAIASTVTQ